LSTIHGNQFVLPLLIRELDQFPSIEDDAELALALYLITKDLEDSHRVISFSKLLWPLLSIQGVISTHIILDALKVFSKEDKFTNPPRQPLIGHILRNIDNQSHIEQLERIIDVLQYEDKEAEELGEGEESEYQVYQIESLINPEFLKTLKHLIPKLEYKSIEGYMPLDTSLSTEKALDLAQKYREIIKTLKGNAHRWETQIDLIGEYVDKWLLELNVEIKDVGSRYKSQIEKTSATIDDTQMEEQLKQKQDAIEQWKMTEKKRILENLSVLFKSLDRTLEEVMKKNRFFSSTDTIKRKSFESIIPSIENHFRFLEDSQINFGESIKSIKNKFSEFKEEIKKIDVEANEKLSNFESELNTKLKSRDEQLSQFELEKKNNLEELESRRNKIEELYAKIKDIILRKKSDCLKEAEQLTNWSMQDTEDELFAKPIQWIYMPLYAMFVEDESMMDENMTIVLPGYISKISEGSGELYKITSDRMADLRDTLKEKIDEDMAIRSNFEFSCENNNILKIPNLEKKVQKGIAVLRKNGIIDENIEVKIRERFNSLI